MPQAVTHVLIALIVGRFIRDYFIKDKKKFPLHYVLILGLAGILLSKLGISLKNI